MKLAIRNDEADVVVCLATSRLYRRALTALQFAQEYVVEAGMRCVFVLQSIDSLETDQWQILLQLHAIMDENQLKYMVGHIRAGHEGLLLLERVHSTLAFGYAGKVIEGALTRLRKPSRKIEIDENLRKWVIQVFKWFVDNKANYKAIARRLNAEKVAPPPKVSHWTRHAVKYLLGNRRYVGDWSYGRRETVWMNRLDTSRQIPREKPLRDHRIDRLRIVDDALFGAAYERIESLKLGERTGRWRRDAQGEPLIDLLHGLLWCAKHDRALVPAGSRGQYWLCRACKKIDSPHEQHLYSQLRRDLALKLAVETVVSALRIDDATKQRIVEKASWHIKDALTRPAEDVSKFDNEIANLHGKVAFMFDNLGETASEREHTTKLIDAKRKEIRELKERKKTIEAARTVLSEMPTIERVREEADRRAACILSAQTSDVAADRRAANELLRQIVGGKITLEQVGDRKHSQGHLRGSFRPALVGLVHGMPVLPDDLAEPVVIDFVAPTRLNSDADAVGTMLGENPNMTLQQIGQRLGLLKSTVTKAVKAYYEARGEPVPDMRRRGQQLKYSVKPPPYIRIAEAAAKMYQEGKLLGEIATAVESNRTTVEKSLRYWHDQRGLVYLDGRARRKQLAIKSRRKDI